MKTEKISEVKSDWWCVALDETRHWNLDEEDRPYIKKMLGIYVYNRSEYTYCCEITPSYFLCYIGDVAVLKMDAPDDVCERINERYEVGCYGDDCYMHVHVVEDIPEKQKKHYGEAEGGEEEVREYYQGNSPF